MLHLLLGATTKSFTYDAALVALVLGVVARGLTAFTTRIHDKNARSVVSFAIVVVGAVAAYATNATGDIAVFPDLLIVGAVAAALAIGIDHTWIKQVFDLVDEHFPGFWLPDPNSVGIGRSAKTLYAKSKVAKARAVHGGNPPPPTAGRKVTTDDALPAPEGLPQVDESVRRGK